MLTLTPNSKFNLRFIHAYPHRYAEYKHKFIVPNEIAHQDKKCFWARVLDIINPNKKTKYGEIFL